MWVGTVLGIVMGIGLYAMAFTLPVFLQGNLRMTAEQTGIILLPGALASALSMLVVGRLTSRLDPRLLITLGALLFASAAWRLSLITGDSGAQDFFWPLILRGVGLGFMFVPLTTISMDRIAREKMGNATSLFNLMRNLGGSVGIAVTAFLLSRQQQAYVNVLGANVDAYAPASRTAFEAMRAGFIAAGADVTTATQRAYAAMFGTVQQQASMVSFVLLFRLLGVIFLLLLPLIFLMKKPRSGGGPASAH